MDRKFKKPEYLIAQLKKGNEMAYVFLVDSYHRKLYAYAMSLTNDRDQTQDIIQNVFLKTWEYRKKLNPEQSLQSFLYKSVYNEFINQYWKDQSVKALESTYAKVLNEITEELDDSNLKKLSEIVTKEIQKLPSKCKTVFLLSKKEGLTNIEISEYLNLSLKSVEGHITKAYSIIRKKIDTNSSLFLIILLGVNKLKSKLISNSKESILID